eukprot:403345889
MIICAAAQPIYEYLSYPGGQLGEKFVTINHNGFDIRMRAYCTGPPTFMQSGIVFDPMILIESQLGASGHIHEEIQDYFSDQYTVCTYDRAGMGLSHQSGFTINLENIMQQMVLTMEEIEIPIQLSNKQIICIGHALGGQLCQYYAENLPSIKSIVLLDSYPSQKIYNQLNLAKGLTKEESQSDIWDQVGRDRLMTLLTPLSIVTAVAFNQYYYSDAPLYMYQFFWSYTTAKQQYAQLMFKQQDASTCNYQCAMTPTPKNRINVPTLVISSKNPNEDCTMAGYSQNTESCVIYTKQRDALLLVQDEMADYTSTWSKVEYCTGLCDHDFAYTRPDYVIETIIRNLASL